MIRNGYILKIHAGMSAMLYVSVHYHFAIIVCLKQTTAMANLEEKSGNIRGYMMRVFIVLMKSHDTVVLKSLSKSAI